MQVSHQVVLNHVAFYPHCDRENANKLLEMKNFGSYLIRDSSKGGYVLSIKVNLQAANRIRENNSKESYVSMEKKLETFPKPNDKHKIKKKYSCYPISRKSDFRKKEKEKPEDHALKMSSSNPKISQYEAEILHYRFNINSEDNKLEIPLIDMKREYKCKTIEKLAERIFQSEGFLIELLTPLVNHDNSIEQA